MDSVALLGYHEDVGGWLSAILQNLPLAYGFRASNHYGVGIVDNPVTDCVCQKWIGQLLLLARDVELGAEDRGVLLVPGLQDF